MKIVNINDVNYEDIIGVLENSGLVILPFDTCYGLACNPCDQKAVEKLLKYKARREGKAISIAVSDEETAEKFVELNGTAKKFYERFLPGPFTVISKSKGVVIKDIESEKGTLGIRVPASEWLLNFLDTYEKPITSSSANQAYKKTPYKVEDILKHSSPKALELIDLIVDAGELPHNPPSTVVDTTLGDVQVVRKGQFLPEGAKVNEFISNSEEETIEFGQDMFKKFAKELEFRPLIFALQGDLGAGKTQFTKGIARALGIQENIQSPTFILSREYDSPFGNKLYHIDTWRLENEEEFKELRVEQLAISKEQRTKNREQNGKSVQGWEYASMQGEDCPEEPPSLIGTLAYSQTSSSSALDTRNSLTKLPTSPSEPVNALTRQPVNPLYNILVIEWADKIAGYLRSLDINMKIIWVEIGYDEENENRRIIKWSE